MIAEYLKQIQRRVARQHTRSDLRRMCFVNGWTVPKRALRSAVSHWHMNQQRKNAL